ncbi:TaqI-like C-terminal specificity domain-containing protein [Halarchaeum acidiphilum]
MIKPFIRGRNIERFRIDYDGEYLVYAMDELHRPAFPELFENDKAVVSEISNDLKVACDNDEMYGNEKVVFVVRGSDLTEIPEEIRNRRSIPNVDTISEFGKDIDIRYLTGILNSTLLEFYFEYSVSDGLNVYPDDVRHLPIAKADSQDRLTEEVKTISDLKRRRHALNLSLLDYLGNYADGPALPDVGLYQPTSANVLDATTEDYEKLRVGDVRTRRDGRTVTIEATARYKPDDEDAHETDQWGYTETDYVEAFALADLEETAAALVEAFVPVAVEKADGFAGFRDNATKTNSLVDRLQAVTLPDPDDVAADLERYAETKARADDLDAKIEQTDALIDEIVYDLYGLSDEEIEIVEEAVGE